MTKQLSKFQKEKRRRQAILLRKDFLHGEFDKLWNTYYQRTKCYEELSEILGIDKIWGHFKYMNTHKELDDAEDAIKLMTERRERKKQKPKKVKKKVKPRKIKKVKTLTAREQKIAEAWQKLQDRKKKVSLWDKIKSWLTA